jgi:hypothetical protein
MLSLRDGSRVADELDRQAHIESWRGIWPDLAVHQYFHRTHKVPLDEATLVFHPWNQHFVRLRTEYERSGQCSVPGVGAFQLKVPNAFFYLFATISFEGNSPNLLSFTRDGNHVQLSTNEAVVILNILGGLTTINYTWVKAEGNYIQGLCVLLPPRRKYIFFSPKLFYEYRLQHPEDPGDLATTANAILSSTMTMIKDLP